MEISAIVPGIKPDSRDSRPSSYVPMRALLDALEGAGISATKRETALNALATWGTVEAKVIERKPGNETVLAVAGGRISLKLAQAFETGEMVLLALDPNLKGQAAGTVRTAELSPLSMLLGKLTNIAAPDELPATTSLAAAPVKAEELAIALKNSISQSGMFYESHLAAWADGKRPLESLLAEPQARAISNDRPDENRQADPAKPIVADNLAPLVRRQLDLLDNQNLLWRGDVWPGQSASIEIHPDNQSASTSLDENTSWSTRLRLQMPLLGTIDALISVKGDNTGIRLTGDEPANVSALEGARADLAASLSKHGIHVGQFSVKANA